MSTAGLADVGAESVLMTAMVPAGSSLPDDVVALRRLVLARDAELAAAQAELVQAKARETSAEAMILQLRLAVEKMRRELYGQRSERGARLLDQMELELEELEATASENELAAEMGATGTGVSVRAPRKATSRRLLPDHLPRERVVVLGPTACSCCGSTRLAKLREDVTETLEMVPRSWKVVQHVREKRVHADDTPVCVIPAITRSSPPLSTFEIVPSGTVIAISKSPFARPSAVLGTEPVTV